jgi:hypothetical protein
MLKTVSVATMRVAARERSSARERRHVGVRVGRHGGARQPRAVDEARVVERIGEDLAVAIGERGEDAEVGGIAAAEEHRARQAAEAREAPLRRLVRPHVARDQCRGARADAELVDGAVRCLAQPRVVGEAEIVVAGEVEERRAALAHARTLRRLERAAHAREPVALEGGEAFGQPSGGAHASQPGVRPSSANSASSRATSGLSVVRSLSP